MAILSYEFIESQKENLLWDAEMGLLDKSFTGGLSAYTQENCQVTLTDKGYRIYRPPNLTVDSNGYTMWGGLVLRFPSTNNSYLIQGHTYIIMFDVEGQSSNAPEFYYTNNTGWGGGGLNPSPSNISYCVHPSNFQGKMTVWYQCTINDSIWKTCTSSYSGFVSGTSYLSYRDFKYGFGYSSTGIFGTDLYITNLRMYDITEEERISITKNGVITSSSFNENFECTQFGKQGIINNNEFYEL